MSKNFKIICAVVGVIVGLLFISFPRTNHIYNAPQSKNAKNNLSNTCAGDNITDAVKLRPTKVYKQGIPLIGTTIYTGLCPPPGDADGYAVLVDLASGVFVGVELTIIVRKIFSKPPAKTKKATK